MFEESDSVVEKLIEGIRPQPCVYDTSRGVANRPRFEFDQTAVVPFLVLLAACCQAGYVAPYAYHAAAVHVPVATTVVRQPVVEHHSEVAYVPPHTHGYTISQQKVVHPKTTVTKHDPFFGTYHQADVHHAPVVTGSHSSVHQSRGGHFVHRPVGTVVY
ncbi:hypothetical protein HPB47_012495 [Ixodes persulcatus]|uniref:Uncharacterized protein n=1 Tax=Ixodes persulcatus TaxID=34615 RepID=A0AC60NTD8_IXOPE|nr:hypothetical protein HPB47_012495 [Ixodes persulcatus]